MSQERLAPIVKWVGGKRQLLDEIIPLLPEKFTTYCEPFLGGGAVFFAVQPANAVVNDLNADLIAVYETVRDDVETLIASLKQHKNTEAYFYQIRDLDRNPEQYQAMSKIEKASRLLYLNKTCFNGLFRVNKSGKFNTSYGRYKNPDIVNEAGLRAASKFLNESKIEFCSGDFEQVLSRCPAGSFVYLDPPYDPVSNTANFTSYNKDGFSQNQQIRLKECCDELTNRKVKFMLSNSATDFIEDLYSGYDITIVKARRAVNANAAKRGAVDEVIIRNYEGGKSNDH